MDDNTFLGGDVPAPTPGLGANPPDFSQQIENVVQPVVNAVENTAAARIGNIQMIAVDSSDLAAYGYDPIEFQLQIQFTNGRVYVYENISPLDFESISNAPSKGRAFWQLIRRNPLAHPFTRLS